MTGAELSAPRRKGLRARFASTPFRTFVVYPIVVCAFELFYQGAQFSIMPLGLLFMVWGYAQYRLCGAYRVRKGGGGPGLSRPPERLVAEGPYAWTRNPMYLGHLIYMYGIMLTFRSWLGLAILVFHVFWFHRRVLEDEAHMRTLFGPAYEAYAARVKRWIPGLF
jgi:protein-S-isoprenylcysteine O-methyltransferase Ste14